MWVLIVLATELREELSDLQLQIGGQRSSQYIGLLQLDARSASLVEFVDDVAESLEVRIDRSIKRELHIGNGEAVHMGIVVTDLNRADIGLGGPPRIRQGDKPDIHV